MIPRFDQNYIFSIQFVQLILENQNQSRIDQLNPDRSEQNQIDQLDCLIAKGLDTDESFLPEHKFAANWNEVNFKSWNS